mmetsp:Transcript_4408/g.9558  ORF Transcript_4408/g.9558 Transcript_4408/m.9558 type:complete len:214 (-) Transcript_4408:606-1247(-)
MSAFNLNFVASLTLQLLLLSTSTTVEGFQNNNDLISRCLASPSSTTVKVDTRVFNSNDDVNDDDEDPWSSSPPISKTSSPLSQQLEQGTFNPLNYRGKNKTNRSSGSAQAQVSLRALRMSSFTDDLLNSLGDKTATRAILEENRDFLLEPLESEDSLAGSGSIYTPEMSRAERYQTYKNSVNKRLESSKNPTAKAVLTAMRDFVMEFEDKKLL